MKNERYTIGATTYGADWKNSRLVPVAGKKAELMEFGCAEEMEDYIKEQNKELLWLRNRSGRATE